MSKRNNNENREKSLPGTLMRAGIMLYWTISTIYAETEFIFTFFGLLGLWSALTDLKPALESYRRKREFEKGIQQQEEYTEYLDKDKMNFCCPHCGEILKEDGDNIFCPFCGKTLYEK